MASSSREARRRKILERGSDRLAFITGQVNDVPSPPSPQSNLLHSDDSLPDAIPPRDQILSDQETGVTSRQENISVASMLDDIDQIIQKSRPESLQPRKQTETLSESSASDSRDATPQASPATSRAQASSTVNLSASQAFTPLVSYMNTITPKHIGAAIDASEYARMFSSLAIALLVISSHLGFSSLGKIVSFRPVFLLLLTDATIVLGCALLSHRGDSSSASGTGLNGQQGVMDQVSNAIETVMMVKKVMEAVSIDFSLYAVILICGLLLAQSIFV
ncbi:unnamed protein product [Cochlearia groenlandica]